MGDIHWANQKPTIGHEQSRIRPVLILSSDAFNEKSGTVIAVALTGSVAESQIFTGTFPRRSSNVKGIVGEN